MFDWEERRRQQEEEGEMLDKLIKESKMASKKSIQGKKWCNKRKKGKKN